MDATVGDEDDLPFQGPAPGTIIGGKFTLLRLVAAGGVGAVYEAEDQLVGRRVALKVLLPRYASHPEIVRRFRREAQATAAIEHPNVVMILEVGHHQDGSPYIVQELLKGDNLRAHLERHGRVTAPDAIALLSPIMGALEAGHRRGIVHRDLKPENIIVSRSASGDLIPKLVDFGAAKMRSGRAVLVTQVGFQIGTPAYMSPEQVRGDAIVDLRTDVWAIGVVLLEAITGKALFAGQSDAVTYVNILSKVEECVAPLVADVPPPLRDVLKRALDPERDARFPSMQAFREALWEAWQWNPVATAATGSSQWPPVLRGTPEPSRPQILEIVSLDDDDFSETDEAADAFVPASDGDSPGDTTLADAPRKRADDADAREAEQALAENALDRALELADQAMEARADDAGLRGRMCAVQAVAHFWLGAYVASWRKAFVAAQHLPRASVGWHAAKGHLAMAFGHLGRNDDLLAVADDLAGVRSEIDDWDAHAIAVARTTVFLIRAGAIERATALLDGVRGERRVEAALALAWIDVARAELARHQGDPIADLAHVEAAVAGFAAAGDIRNACLQRANVGNAYTLLGAFEVAEAKLRESLAVAEPMRLSFVEPVKANLGFVLSRLGRMEESAAMLRGAIAACKELRYGRFEAVARVYLAMVLLTSGDTDGAEQAARDALLASKSSPHVQAMALATLARVLLLDDAPAMSLAAATEAFELMSRMEGVEECAGLIGLTHAEALKAAGRDEEAKMALAAARTRLFDHAERIRDERWRRCFLERVPEHARTIELAREWALTDPIA